MFLNRILNEEKIHIAYSFFNFLLCNGVYAKEIEIMYHRADTFLPAFLYAIIKK